MDQNLHVVPPPNRVTYQQMQACKQHKLFADAGGLEGIDYSSLLTAWAVAVRPTANEPSSGYFYWLGGDSIQYQRFKAKQNSP